MDKSREELELERAVFGDRDGFESALLRLNGAESDAESDAASGDENSDADSESGFYIDRGEADSDASGSEDAELSAGAATSDDEALAVWNDSDDDAVAVDLTAAARSRKLRRSLAESAVSGRDYEARLRAHFLRLYAPPAWTHTKPAARHGASDAESDDASDSEGDVRANPLKDVLARTTRYVSATKLSLIPPQDLDIQRLADVTKQRASASVVQSIAFHPTQPLVLTGGFDQTLRVYQIDGKHNAVATSLHVRNSPFQTAVFHPDGQRVVAAGRRRYLLLWDLATGAVSKVSRLYGQEHTQRTFERFVLSPDGEHLALIGEHGWMNVLSARSGQWLAGVKIEGTLVDLAWTEERYVTLVSASGEVWVWDAVQRAVAQRWRDPGLVGVTRVAQSAQWLAIGLQSGVVAFYRRQPVTASTAPGAAGVTASEAETRQPSGVVENLVTAVDSLAFNPDGQLLAVASRLQRDALRIVHVASFTVFRNWPTAGTPLGRVSCVAWSPDGRMLAAGNEGGTARCWALNHYA